MWLRLLTLPPWRRAPARLLRSPSLFGSVALAAIVLGIAGGSRPLFASSAASAALHSDIAGGCPYEVGMRVQRQGAMASPAPPSSELRPTVDIAHGTRVLDTATSGLPGLAPVVVTTFGGTARIAKAGSSSDSTSIQLIARTNAGRYIDVLHSVPASGISIPDVTATRLGLHAGDRVTIESNAVPTPVTVHAVFRDLGGAHRDAYWCSLQQPLDGYGVSVPPPTVLLDEADLQRLLTHSGTPAAETWWEYAPDPAHWSIANAHHTIPRLEALGAATSNLSLPEGRVFGLGTTSVDHQSTIAHSDQASRTGSATVGPVALGGAGVALLILLVAARTWLDRRRKEVTVLALRGAGPAAIALKGVLEMGPPMLVGGAIGIGAGDLIVRTIGPSSIIDPHAVVSATALVGAALAVALASVALVVWFGVRRVGIESGSASARARLLLWEPAVLALAGAAFYELTSRSAANGSPGAGAHVDTLVLLFPVLLLAGCAGLLTRALLRGSLLRLGSGRRSTALWLGTRRVAAGRLRAIPLVTGASVAVGIVVFSGTLASSLRATIDAKSTLGVGTAQAFTLTSAHPLSASSPFRTDATAVTRTRENNNASPGHARADVLGVDPSTFGRGAYWDSTFASRSLASLLRLLPPPAIGSTMPVIAVGDGLPDRFVLSLDTERNHRSGTTMLPVRVVARARAFPGFEFESDRPLVVIDHAALDRVGVVDTSELWVNRTDLSIRSQLIDAGFPVTSVLRASALTPGDLAPQLWALRYLQIIGLVAGLVTVGGLGLYFAAIAERRRLGIAIAQKLGISRRAAVGATATEIGTMIATAFVLGTVLSVVAVRLVFHHVDPAPQIPPAALFRLDPGSIVVCLLGGAFVTLILTAIVEWSARQLRLPELLRRAD